GEELFSQKRTRRYSGSGLRRKPQVGSESRGNLKFFEEADQVLFQGDKGPSTPFTSNQTEPVHPTDEPAGPDGHDAVDAFALPPPVDFKIPRPVNPKEAQTQRDPRVDYFLLLEDLTAGMKRPCIMDLKMGTRQYGVDATPAKLKSQRGKCAKTTSRELGVRVCGLQVWDAKTRSYIFRDKYEGRRIKAGTEFQEALTRFLYNGVDYHSVLRQIPTILRKLDELHRIARGLRGYRFYAASLLMFYDGADAVDDVVDDSTTDAATDAEEAQTPRRRRRNKREVDFKIADFANSITARTHVADKACPPRYPDEPDRGFLRGLKSLREYFVKIQRDVRAEAGIETRARAEEWEEEEGHVSE
ncbi:inositol polyphosphate kinase family protein, partial [Candidatus Bathyarchaeota archaeon]|nr:inositol polyphosphate kinase family protein [Candidatus Bathyarchaeota archaeon]